jgi:hypothetical protein
MSKFLLNLFQSRVSLRVSDVFDCLVVLYATVLNVQFQYLRYFRSQAYDLSFEDA